MFNNKYTRFALMAPAFFPGITGAAAGVIHGFHTAYNFEADISKPKRIVLSLLIAARQAALGWFRLASFSIFTYEVMNSFYINKKKPDLTPQVTAFTGLKNTELLDKPRSHVAELSKPKSKIGSSSCISL